MNTAQTEASRAEYEQQRQDLLNALSSAGLQTRVAEFEPLIRDTIGISLLPSSRASIAPRLSRLGGLPELPLGTKWPHSEGEPLPFLGQLALAEIAPFDVHGRLPEEGLLSLFVGDPLNAAGVPTAHAEVIHVAVGGDLKAPPCPDPPRWWTQKVTKPRRLVFSAKATLPNHGRALQRDDHEYRDFHEDYYDFANAPPRHGMLCFDQGHGAVATGEELLLRLDADDLPYSFDWCESVALYVIIASDALARCDFSATRAHLGCGL